MSALSIAPIVFALLFGSSAASAGWPWPWCQVTGKGAKTTKTFGNLPGYTKILVDSGIAATVSVGSAEAFSVNLYENVVDRLIVKVVGDTLHIQLQPRTCNAQAQATIVVQKPLLGVTAQGGSSMDIDKLKGSIAASGGSHVTVGEISAASISISSNGGSPLTVKGGSVSSLDVTGNGGSTLDLGSLEVGAGQCSLTGGSGVSGMVANTLSIDLQGGSHLEAEVKQKATGTCSGGGYVSISGGGDTSGISADSGCSLQGSSADISV